MTDFRKLVVWEKAHALAVSIHSLAAEMRQSQYASVRKQMIRAGESVPTNIAEASRQESRRDFARFLRYALNSASELEYHFILATDIGAVRRDEGEALIASITEVRKMLHGLLRRVSALPKGARISKYANVTTDTRTSEPLSNLPPLGRTKAAGAGLQINRLPDS